MGVYKAAVITDAGQELIAQAVAGGTTITFPTVKTSSHAYPEGTNLAALTDLQNIVQTAAPTSVQVFNDTMVQVSVRFDNSEIEQAYLIQTIGLYAKGASGEAVLFSIVQADTPDQMPAKSPVSPSAFIFNIQTTVQQAGSIAVTVNPAGTATVEDLQLLGSQKVDINGGNASNTTVTIQEAAEGESYPTIESGTLKSVVGKIKRFLESLKEDKVDSQSGDTANTKVAAIEESTASFPEPAAGDTTKTLWGKVKKWQQDCIAKFGNYVLMSMITNQHINDTSHIPTSALVYLMQQAIAANQSAISVLNNNLQKPGIVSAVRYPNGFTEQVADMLKTSFCFGVVDIPTGASDPYSPFPGVGPHWWNVITFGVSNRCEQFAVYGFQKVELDGMIFVRRQHDNYLSGWIQIL